jgi:lipopolysaccharide transport system ATP-binding protein
MTRLVLRVSDVGKCYTTYSSNIARFATWFGVPVKTKKEHWAVRNVGFDLWSGQALALIGENGAGKSTLLKLITGTVRPTVGSIAVGGRIGAILELGLGFNPNLTGRENIRLSGGLMGIAPYLLEEKMSEIEDFAELGRFFDEPLRVYSSGMQARLAFSLATSVECDLLIVDEVLAVGDSYFQHKSFDRIRRMKAAGTAILFVSHSMADVRALCDRVILMDRGMIAKDGTPDAVVDFYNALIAKKESDRDVIFQERRPDGWLHTRSGTYDAVVDDVSLLDAEDGRALETVPVGRRVVLSVDVRAERDIERLVLGVMLRDRAGHVVWGTNTWHTKQVLEHVRSGERIRYALAFECRLGAGSYAITLALSSTESHLVDNFEWRDNAFVFDVVNVDKAVFVGTTWLAVDCDIQRI